MKRRGRRFRVASIIALLLTFSVAASASAAPGAAKLNGPTVTPVTGTTSTLFVFSVHFIGSASDEAVSVSVSVAGSSMALVLSGGTPQNGTWTGSRTLPAGSWPVEFTSISSGGTNPPIAGPTVVVTAPTPTPVPTPVPTAVPPPPTPRPTARPTAVPATATPLPGTSVTPAPTPFGTTVTNPSNSPGDSGTAAASAEASPSPSASPAGTGSPGRRPFNVPVEGVVAIGLLGAVTVAAALGERRRRRAVAAFRAGLATSDDPYAAAADADDLQAGSDLVDDETVATIDYDGLEDGPDA
jgi:hypothetical protein